MSAPEVALSETEIRELEKSWVGCHASFMDAVEHALQRKRYDQARASGPSYAEALDTVLAAASAQGSALRVGPRVAEIDAAIDKVRDTHDRQLRWLLWSASRRATDLLDEPERHPQAYPDELERLEAALAAFSPYKGTSPR